jgi:hypothetical protein
MERGLVFSLPENPVVVAVEKSDDPIGIQLRSAEEFYQ